MSITLIAGIALVLLPIIVLFFETGKRFGWRVTLMTYGLSIITMAIVVAGAYLIAISIT